MILAKRKDRKATHGWMDGIREELTDGTIDWEKEQKKAENDPSLPIFVHYRRGITRSSGDSTKYCFCSECQDGISTLYVICDRNSALATCAESFLRKITPCHRYLSLLSSYSHAVPFAIRSPILPPTHCSLLIHNFFAGTRSYSGVSIWNSTTTRPTAIAIARQS